KFRARFPRVINAAPHLSTWISYHPLAKEKDSPLWVAFDNNRKGEALQQVGLRKIVKRIAIRAHIQKHVWPYLFRHSRNTELATMVSASVMDEIAGWVQGSPMPAFYVHLSGKNTDDALLRAHGIIKEEKKKMPTQCPRCSHVNAPEQELCSKCGMALSLEAAMKEDQKREKEQQEFKADFAAYKNLTKLRLALDREKNEARKAEIIKEMERLVGS
ncbi:MAG: hypothetical protein M1587_11390, partial [Thaumarchaeota archaeon]|nr:hypothetical protein [Nitrososphaerota archaeon]